MSENICIGASEIDGLAEQRLVLRTAALKNLIKCYLEFADSLSSKDNEEVNKKAAELETELAEFERKAARINDQAAAEARDIDAVIESSHSIANNFHEAEEELRVVKLKLEQEQAATSSRQSAARIAEELKAYDHIEEIQNQLNTVQHEVNRAQARCAKLEVRLRTRQNQLAPIQSAIEQLQASVIGKQQEKEQQQQEEEEEIKERNDAESVVDDDQIDTMKDEDF